MTSLIKRSGGAVAIARPEKVFECPLGAKCSHSDINECQQFALEQEHRKTCPDGEKCPHFGSRRALKGIPPAARYSGTQRLPHELRAIANGAKEEDGKNDE